MVKTFFYVWTCLLYEFLGNKINDTFEIKHIIDKPYSLDCDYISMKKDVSNDLNMSIIYNL